MTDQWPYSVFFQFFSFHHPTFLLPFLRLVFFIFLFPFSFSFFLFFSFCSIFSLSNIFFCFFSYYLTIALSSFFFFYYICLTAFPFSFPSYLNFFSYRFIFAFFIFVYLLIYLLSHFLSTSFTHFPFKHSLHSQVINTHAQRLFTFPSPLRCSNRYGKVKIYIYT